MDATYPQCSKDDRYSLGKVRAPEYSIVSDFPGKIPDSAPSRRPTVLKKIIICTYADCSFPYKIAIRDTSQAIDLRTMIPDWGVKGKSSVGKYTTKQKLKRVYIS